MRRAGHLVRMERGELHTSLRCGNLKESYHLEDLNVDGRIILKYLFKKLEGLHRPDYSVSG